MMNTNLPEHNTGASTETERTKPEVVGCEIKEKTDTEREKLKGSVS